jgi:fimbrial chaperone protein
MNITSFGFHRTTAYRTALCVLALLLPGLAGATQWDVDPVRVELSQEQQTAAITIKNESDQPTSIQIQAVAWKQVDGVDVYTPTRELIVTPPIATIAAKSEQVVRVALRRPADARNELTYRISLQELPPKPEPGFLGVQVALRIGLPVFVQPQTGVAVPKLSWNVSRMPDNKLKVAVQNHGNAHIQVSDFALYAPGSTDALTGDSGSHYVLAGQTQEWLLTTRALEKLPAGRLRLKAYTDASDVDTELVLDRP